MELNLDQSMDEYIKFYTHEKDDWKIATGFFCVLLQFWKRVKKSIYLLLNSYCAECKLFAILCHFFARDLLRIFLCTLKLCLKFFYLVNIFVLTLKNLFIFVYKNLKLTWSIKCVHMLGLNTLKIIRLRIVIIIIFLCWMLVSSWTCLKW